MSAGRGFIGYLEFEELSFTCALLMTFEVACCIEVPANPVWRFPNEF